MMDTIGNRKDLIRLLDSLLGSNGFIRRKETWYNTTNECIHVVDLDKSAYGGQFYLNIGIALKALAKSEFPPERLCDVRIRLWRITKDFAKISICDQNVERAFNLEDLSISSKERERIVTESILERAIPLFEKLKTEEDAKRFVEEYRGGSWWITRYILEHFDLLTQ